MTVNTFYKGYDRWYHDETLGDKAPGVSAIKNMLPKEALINWSAEEAAIFAVSNIPAVSGLVRSGQVDIAVDMIRDAHKRAKTKAGDAGTTVHTHCEQLMRDKLLGVKSAFSVTAEEKRYLVHFARIAQAFKFEPVLVESVVWNDEPDYAGRLDLLTWLTMPDIESVRNSRFNPGERILAIVDNKTAASGIWPETALQQTGYARAQWYIDARGERQPMYHVEAAFGLWLRPEGAALVPVDIGDETWEQFKRLHGTFYWDRTQAKKTVGAAISANALKRKPKMRWAGRTMPTLT
jgi:hypothetical protein